MESENQNNQVEEIIEETQREAVINRPYNFAGSINKVTKNRFNIDKTKIIYGPSTTVPAIIKLFSEALDNPIDVAIKGGCNKINIEVDSESIHITDNGYGVNTKLAADGESIVYKAFCKYNTSSNYQDKKGKGQKGTNGLGIKLCATLSTYLEVFSEDSEGRVQLIATENNLNHKITNLKKTKKTGVDIYFKPDFSIFEIDEIDEDHINRMYEYTLMQALTYPDITFKFNGERLKYTPRQFMKLLSEHATIEEHDDFFVAITSNMDGEFRQLSYINGLEISKGGTHVNLIADTITKNIREKIVKKYKNIKPSDVKNKLMVTIIGKNMHDIAWEGQVKDTIASTPAQVRKYFNELDLNKLSDKVYKNKSIVDPIIDYFKIEEAYNNKKDLEKSATKKEIKSEKYTKPIGENKVLILCEGQSAKGGLISVLGRQGIGYYELKGKPLNAYTAKYDKFRGNPELWELYQIIKTEKYDRVITGTDQDLDGIQIGSLIIGFYEKYLPEDLRAGILGRLITPVFFTRGKDDKPKDWFYNIRDIPNEKGEYMKGLGSWEPEDLEYIVQKDGIENMMQTFEFDGVEVIDNWIGDDSEPRKEAIMANDFSIITA